MTIGNKIRHYRDLRGYTQAELGEKVGLQADRIRQYESGARTPKADLLGAIADALDVDVAALSDINIKNEEDIMHILFNLEDHYDMNIEKKDGKTVLVFEPNDSNNSVLNTYLNFWYDKRQALSLDSGNEARIKDYKSWQGRFKTNETAFEENIKQGISDKYKAEVEKLTKAKTTHCKTLAELIKLLCNISPELLIDTDYLTTDLILQDFGYGLVFDASKLLEQESLSLDFARFLYEFKNIKNYCHCYSTIEYTGTILKITYFMKSYAFRPLHDLINDWINFNRKSDSYSVLAKNEFTKQFENEVQQYNDADIKELIKYMDCNHLTWIEN